MLNRIMVFLGTSEEDASRQIAATQIPLPITLELRKIDGAPVLFVDDEFSQVWRRTGVALDRAGLFVEQQDEAKGIYYVTYTVPEGGERAGFFSRLFSGGEDLEVNELYQVHVQSRNNQTLITAHDNGEDDTPAALDPEAAEKILQRLKKAYQIGGSNV
jgi:outer membrane protein assembly factor BamC